MAPSRKDRSRLAARNRKPVRLLLESLEERLTPSGGNPTVTQTVGDYNALTAAVAADTAANTNYVIQISNSFQFNSGGQVSISNQGAGSTLTIEGQNGTNYTLTGNGNRLFMIGSGQNVTFADLTLTGGTVTTPNGVAQGGAIEDLGGNVTLSKMIVQANTVTGKAAAGGGVYASGAGTLLIRDSILSDNSAQGAQSYEQYLFGAEGGGLYAFGSGWTVTLMGDTLSGNTAIGDVDAAGGAAYISVSSGGSGNLTILNDPSAPSNDPSLMIDNTAQGGNGGQAAGGALVVSQNSDANINVNIGNTTFYGNKAVGGNDGGEAFGGGLDLFADYGSFTLVNNTVAENSAIGGASGGSFGQGLAEGGGIFVFVGYKVANVANVFDNNTITQNMIDGGVQYVPPPQTANGTGYFFQSDGSGIYGADANTVLLNNVIQDNRSINSPGSTNYPAVDLLAVGTLSNASNNFIATMSPNAVSTSTNIVGSTQVQVGNVVGVDANGNPTGGPIYYPLLSGTVSIGAGTTSVQDTIAGVEGTTSANATDEIGNPRSSNGSINLGAVQTVTPVSSYALVLTDDPASQTVTAGSNVTLTASASGNPTPTVQWQVSTDGGKTWSNISGTNTTLTLNSVSLAMSGNEYQAVFTNSSGSVTSATAILTVNAPPVITGSPSSQMVTAGQTAIFTASASGDPTPTVQWQVSTDGGNTWSNISGATSATLTLNTVTPSMNGYAYRAVFSNSVSNAVSGAATLTVYTPASPPPTLKVPPLLAFFNELLRGSETVNANGTETITDSLFGIPLLVSTFDSSGNLVSVDLFGFNITFLFG